jgi:hypothetical protein
MRLTWLSPHVSKQENLLRYGRDCFEIERFQNFKCRNKPLAVDSLSSFHFHGTRIQEKVFPMIVPELPRKGPSVLYMRICNLLIRFAKLMMFVFAPLISLGLTNFNDAPSRRFLFKAFVTCTLMSC